MNWSSAPPVLGQHAQRAVFGVDEVAGLLDDPPQDHGQVQLAVEDHDGLQQSAQLGGILDPVEGLHGVQAKGRPPPHWSGRSRP